MHPLWVAAVAREARNLAACSPRLDLLLTWMWICEHKVFALVPLPARHCHDCIVRLRQLSSVSLQQKRRRSAASKLGSMAGMGWQATPTAPREAHCCMLMGADRQLACLQDVVSWRVVGFHELADPQKVSSAQPADVVTVVINKHGISCLCVVNNTVVRLHGLHCIVPDGRQAKLYAQARLTYPCGPPQGARVQSGCRMSDVCRPCSARCPVQACVVPPECRRRRWWSLPPRPPLPGRQVRPGSPPVQIRPK